MVWRGGGGVWWRGGGGVWWRGVEECVYSGGGVFWDSDDCVVRGGDMVVGYRIVYGSHEKS